MRCVGCTGSGCISFICGVACIGSTLTAGHFSFGKSNQNHVLPVWPAPKSRFVVSGLAWMKSKSEGKGKNQAALVLLIVPHAPRGNAAPDAPRPVTRSVRTSATTRSVGAIIVCRAAISQTPQSATLGGRAQALRRGQRGMDAALAAPGHGWPMAACPRSIAGAREPDEGGPDTGANGLVTLPRQSNAP